MEFKIVSRRTEIAYKAEEADEVAQHAEALGQCLYGKCGGCAIEVCVLIRGDLSCMRCR